MLVILKDSILRIFNDSVFFLLDNYVPDSFVYFRNFVAVLVFYPEFLDSFHW